LADDHPVVLEEIRSALAPNYEIVEHVADGGALVEAALRLKPDLIVADITMPVLNGIDAAVQIKKSPARHEAPLCHDALRVPLTQRPRLRREELAMY
jgi:CheY-like chemotaxis protein